MTRKDKLTTAEQHRLLRDGNNIAYLLRLYASLYRLEQQVRVMVAQHAGPAALEVPVRVSSHSTEFEDRVPVVVFQSGLAAMTQGILEQLRELDVRVNVP